MQSGAIFSHARDIELGLANIDADTHYRWVVHTN
jgi:hypothetical protein